MDGARQLGWPLACKQTCGLGYVWGLDVPSPLLDVCRVVGHGGEQNKLKCNPCAKLSLNARFPSLLFLRGRMLPGT